MLKGWAIVLPLCFRVYVAMVQHKVRLFALEDATDPAEMIGRVACQLEESYVDFRARLEVA
jgi:hypothetical protein